MSLDVVRGVGDAVAASREFLLPIEPGRWLRLCLLALFVATGWVAFVLARFLPFPPVFEFSSALFPEVNAVALLAATAGGVALSALALADPFARFAFLDALRYDRLNLRERTGERLARATRLLLFTLGAGALATATASSLSLAIWSGWETLTGGIGSIAGTADIAVTVVAGGVVLFVGVSLFGFFQAAAAFVPPAMVSTDSGATAAFETVWDAFAGRRETFVAYLLVRLLLAAVVAALGLLTAGALAGLVGVLGFVVVVAVFGSVAAAASTLGTVPLAVVAGLLVLGLVVLPVRGVTLTVLLSYDLAVLRAVDPNLALPTADVGGSRAADAPLDLADAEPIVEEPLVPPTAAEGAPDGGAERSGTTGEAEAAGRFEFDVVEASDSDGSAPSTGARATADAHPNEAGTG